MRSQSGSANEDIARLTRQLSGCEQEKASLQATLNGRQEQIVTLNEQILDLRKQRDQTVQQVGDLTVLSQGANQNINQTLAQLEGKDRYIRLLQNAKSKADSINLALAVNLKSVLAQGIEDKDVEVKVDKTVVFINLSDKMLYESGSYNISTRSSEVLSKIAQIVKSRPEVDVMIEGYTDNVPISTTCVKDNWDLSVLRATSVARALQTRHGVDPNKIIPAGRGQFNALADNSTAEGRATNRRTRIIILPKLDQFYDLLNPSNVPK
ncbi:MAG: OmpA family protein [Lewinella sp.]|nr:OmpA family protein [Lewinella sp.]